MFSATAQDFFYFVVGRATDQAERQPISPPPADLKPALPPRTAKHPSLKSRPFPVVAPDVWAKHDRPFLGPRDQKRIERRKAFYAAKRARKRARKQPRSES